ncbi:hypothetical protein ACRAWD_01515 [Caulobacter segnis]
MRDYNPDPRAHRLRRQFRLAAQRATCSFTCAPNTRSSPTTRPATAFRSADRR